MATLTVQQDWQFDASTRRFVLPYTVNTDSGETFQTMSAISSSGWCNVISGTTTSYKTEIQLEENNSLSSRTASITLLLSTTGGTKTYMIKVTQSKFETHPIWQSYPVKIDTRLSYVNYQIKTDGALVYSGKAYATPKSEYAEVDLSKICASHLNSSMEKIFGNPSDFNINESVKSFEMFVNGQIWGSFLFFNSYAYKSNPEYTEDGNNAIILWNPIRHVYDSRQYIIFSFFAPINTSTYEYTFTFGKYNPMSVTPKRGVFEGKKQYTALLKVPSSGADYISVFGENIPITKTCCKYCLYYQNALGGWDSLLLHGTDKQTDKISGYKAVKPIDNTTKEFGTKKYINIITPTYKLNTDLLTDDEASRMHNLIESTEVYLHDLEEDTIIPVNITNSTCEYKTFNNNGKKLFNYTVECEFAQPKIRQ